MQVSTNTRKDPYSHPELQTVDPIHNLLASMELYLPQMATVQQVLTVSVRTNATVGVKPVRAYVPVTSL